MGRVPEKKVKSADSVPFVIYDYLKIFPKDLGTFVSVPNVVIEQINRISQCGYNTWRLPTNGELSLMVSEGLIESAEGYMAADGEKKGIVRLVTEKDSAAELAKREKTPISLYDYLKVFPKDLGEFEFEPKGVITQMNHRGQFGISTWRLPTREELSLMASNKIIESPEGYMAADGEKRGTVRLVSDDSVKADLEVEIDVEEASAAEKRKAEAEAEAKRRAEAEAEAKRKAEAEAEAKRKAEAEAEAKRRAAAEAEAKRRAAAEAEAKRRAAAEAEAKRKAEAEAEAKRRAEAEAEAKRKAAAEAEAKRRAEAEAEAKRRAEAEAEAKRKAAAEAEAKRRAEAEAEAKRKAAAEAEAKRKAEAKPAAQGEPQSAENMSYAEVEQKFNEDQEKKYAEMKRKAEEARKAEDELALKAMEARMQKAEEEAKIKAEIRRKAEAERIAAEELLKKSGKNGSGEVRLEPALGKVVEFGSFEQGDGRRPISWRVFEIKDGKALLISEKGLDARRFNPEGRGSEWKYSELRTWLNSDFMNSAFNAAELGKIDQVDGESVFLLSKAEVERFFPDRNSRRCAPTKYAEKRGVEPIDGFARWWLRAPGNGSFYASFVQAKGLFNNSYVYCEEIMVRPAVWVRI